MQEERNKAGIETVGQVLTIGITDHLPLWFMRRNEVAVEIENPTS